MRGPIAVVGAGLAGLACAQRLAASDRAVVVFDKARGPGGRISTRRNEQCAFDHGAQYFTARDPEFARVARRWRALGWVEPWEARFVRLGSSRPEPAPPQERFVAVPGMSALGRALATGLDLRLRTRIAAIEGGVGTRTLVAEDGRRFDGFAGVVVAVPPAQALPLLTAAPALARAVAGVELAPCQAALVAFDAPWDPGFDAAVVESGPLAWVARDSSKPRRASPDCWVLHATPAWSEAHLEDAREAVSAALLDALGRLSAAPLPGIRHRDAHRWLYARTVAALGERCLWDGDAGLGVCGDWCLGARVELAWRSGTELASRVWSRIAPGPHAPGMHASTR